MIKKLSNKKRLITSALPYVNNEPHLGNIIGCVLSADVFARFSRSKEYETLYICGTDEYGTATEHKAVEQNTTPAEICNHYHKIHKKIYSDFNISFDAFGRTSDPEHTEVVQSMFVDVQKNGYIVEKETEQFYSEKLQKFLADRFIKGICPKCGFIEARGDQCDGCGELLDPTELIEPRSSLDDSVPELRKTKHMFLDLSKISPKLEAFQESVMKKGLWPVNAETTTKSWMERGLEPRAITRDLKWGVPVLQVGYENKVFYVWFDAPLGYISITKKAFPNDWKKWWQSPEDTELYQFMAKDNIPFHSVIFPATLIASGCDWTKIHHLNSTEYLTYEGDKFSKSHNTGVFGSDVANSGIDVDLWRFYLLFNRPEKQDTSFVWADFFEKVNSEFIDNVGNLVHRSLTYCQKNFESTCPDAPFKEEHKTFIELVKKLESEAEHFFEKVKMRDALRSILAISRAGNKFFQDREPWVKIKTDKDDVAATVRVLIHLVKDLAIMFEPFMPQTSMRMNSFLNISNLKWDKLGDFDSLNGKKINQPEILHVKLDIKLAEEFKKKFGNADEDPWKQASIKVGKILSVEKHPNAEHLYVESIDLGEEKPRTIVSALVKYFDKAELVGKLVLTVCNLPKVEFAGILSEGMVLCAIKKKKCEIVEIENGNPGDIVVRGDDVTNKSESESIDIDIFKKINLRTKEGVVNCDDIPLKVNGATIETRLVKNSKIS
jgi:methionyl-tRNA synthetase